MAISQYPHLTGLTVERPADDVFHQCVRAGKRVADMGSLFVSWTPHPTRRFGAQWLGTKTRSRATCGEHSGLASQLPLRKRFRAASLSSAVESPRAEWPLVVRPLDFESRTGKASTARTSSGWIPPMKVSGMGLGLRMRSRSPTSERESEHRTMLIIRPPELFRPDRAVGICRSRPLGRHSLRSRYSEPICGCPCEAKRRQLNHSFRRSCHTDEESCRREPVDAPSAFRRVVACNHKPTAD